MYLCIYLSIYLSTYLSTHLSMHRCIYKHQPQTVSHALVPGSCGICSTDSTNPGPISLGADSCVCMGLQVPKCSSMGGYFKDTNMYPRPIERPLEGSRTGKGLPAVGLGLHLGVPRRFGRSRKAHMCRPFGSLFFGGPKDQINRRISISCSKAQHKGVPEIIFCRISMFMWSLGAQLFQALLVVGAW